MVGTRNVAFPRLNAFSYYIYVFGGVLLWTLVHSEHRPRRGLVRLRAALADPASRPASARDIWSQMITFTEVSALGGATVDDHRYVFKHTRARHVAEPHSDLRLGASDISSFMMIFAMPAVMVASAHAARWIADASTRSSSIQPKAATPALSAYVLVFRPSGGLHHFIPGTAMVSTIVADIFAAKNLRLHGARAVD